MGTLFSCFIAVKDNSNLLTVAKQVGPLRLPYIRTGDAYCFHSALPRSHSVKLAFAEIANCLIAGTNREKMESLVSGVEKFRTGVPQGSVSDSPCTVTAIFVGDSQSSSVATTTDSSQPESVNRRVTETSFTVEGGSCGVERFDVVVMQGKSSLAIHTRP